MEFAERLRSAMGQTSAYALSKKSGVDQGQLSRYLGGSATPSLATASKLASALGINVGWLAHGQGEMRSRVVPLKSASTTRLTPFAWARMESNFSGGLIEDLGAAAIRLLDPGAPLAPPSEARPLGALVPVSTLGRLGALHDQLVAFVAQAPLPPSIDAGDRLVVDLTKRRASEGVFLFASGGDLWLRLVRRRPDGELELVSDGASMVVGDADLENAVGKVVWRSGKV